jgi:hypothetical protein
MDGRAVPTTNAKLTMIVDALWPTKVGIDHLDLSLLPPIPLHQSEPTLTVPGMDKLLDQLTSATRLYLGNEDATPTITASWLTEGSKAHPLHCDIHQTGAYVAVLWISGDTGCGGDLRLWDPRWWDPKLFGGQYANSFEQYPFTPGQLTIFPSLLWHDVTEYTGVTLRRSLNIVFSVDTTMNEVYSQLALIELQRIARDRGIPFDGSNCQIWQVLSQLR